MSGFVKIYGSKLITSSLWDEPPEARLVFLAMLAIADARGYVDVPNERALARVLNLAAAYVAKALAILMAPDKGSRTVAHEGRRVLRDGSGWLCVNYEKYREFRSAAQEATRLRVERHRKRAVVTRNSRNDAVTPVTPEAEAEAEAEGGDPEALAPDSELATNPDVPRAAVTPPPTPPPSPSPAGTPPFWRAAVWLSKFADAWAKHYGNLTYPSGDAEARAVAQLAEILTQLPDGERVAAQGRAGEMFAEYLDDSRADSGRHPFKWFVERFVGLRAPAPRGEGKVASKNRRAATAFAEES